MSDELSARFEELNRNLDVMRAKTRIADLKGRVAAGGSLTSAESRELADLEALVAKHLTDR